MKRLNYLLTKSTNWLLAGLLILFGFSCSEGKDEPQFPDQKQDPEVPDEPGGGMVEYGTPYTVFRIKGKVVEEGLQQPLDGIQVEIRYDQGFKDDLYASLFRDTLYTDTDGTFEWVNYNYSGTETRSVQLIPTEILENMDRGPFAPDTTFIEFVKEDLQEGSGWLIGEAEKEITISLKPVSGEGETNKEGEE